jgi:hypothetical protein
MVEQRSLTERRPGTLRVEDLLAPPGRELTERDAAFHQDVEATAWLPLREEHLALLQGALRAAPEQPAPLCQRK